MKKKIGVLIILGLFALLPLSPVLAADPPAGKGIGELRTNLGTFGGQTGLGTAGDSDLKGKVANIINIVLGFLGVFAVIMIIIAGFRWMTAGGNEETVKKARTSITNAAIGLLVVLASFIIVNFAVTYLSRATGAEGGGGGEPGVAEDRDTG